MTYDSFGGSRPDFVLPEHVLNWDGEPGPALSGAETGSVFQSEGNGPVFSDDELGDPLFGHIDLDFSASPLGEGALGVPTMKEALLPIGGEKPVKLSGKKAETLGQKQEKRQEIPAVASIQDAVMGRISLTVKQVFDIELEIYSDLIASQPHCNLDDIWGEMLVMDTDLPSDDEVHDHGLLHARSVEFQNAQTRLDWMESKVNGFITLREEASDKLSEIAYNLFDGNTIPERKANATTLLLPITRGLSQYKSALNDVRNLRKTLRDGQERIRYLLINKQAEMKYGGLVNEGNNYLMHRAAQRLAEDTQEAEAPVTARSLRQSA